MYMTNEYRDKLTKECEQLQKEIAELRGKIYDIRKSIIDSRKPEIIKIEGKILKLEYDLHNIKSKLQQFYSPKVVELTVVYDDELDLDRLLNGEIKGVLL